MATREEIREGVRDIIEGYCDFERESTYQHFRDEILTYLDSKDVVIKVEDWLPIRSGMTCTIEPLIEEVKDGE